MAQIGPEAHADRGELPEIGHQPRVRVGREAAAVLQLAAEVLELLRREAPFEERARVDPGRRVPLEVDDVAVVVVALALEEVIEADLVERCGRRISGDVAADAVLGLVGLHHHGERVPADEALDAPLDLAAAGERRLVVGGNRVDVGCVGGERQLDAVAARVVAQLAQQLADPDRAARLDHVVERLEPLARFEGLDLGGVFWCCVPHESSWNHPAERGRGR